MATLKTLTAAEAEMAALAAAAIADGFPVKVIPMGVSGVAAAGDSKYLLDFEFDYPTWANLNHNPLF